MGASKKVEAFLAHYASDYYDPEKAHAYYERTKQLKGKREAEKLSSGQTEVWNVARDQINQRKTADLESAKTNQTERIAALNKTAQETMERINQKLTERLEQIRGELKIPANASPKLRAFLTKQFNQRSASAKAASAEQRRQIGIQIRTALNTAREDYAANRKATEEKYKQASETELATIRSKVK